MKLIYSICISIFCIVSAQAQNNLEEVVYLKNGNVYRGVIIEQIPNESLKIKIAGGSIFNVPLAEVAKFTKEPKPNTHPISIENREPAIGLNNPTSNPLIRTNLESNSPNLFTPKYANGKLGKLFYFKSKGYFGYAELAGGLMYGNVRMVQGYKFNRFAYLGIGTGIDFYSYFKNDGMSGIQIPLFLHYECDFLKTKVTPYLEAELGWGFNLWGDNQEYNRNENSQSYISNAKAFGGPMGSLGLGVKIFTKSRFILKITPEFSWKWVKGSYDQINTLVVGPYPYPQTITNRTFGSAFGMKIGFGF